MHPQDNAIIALKLRLHGKTSLRKINQVLSTSPYDAIFHFVLESAANIRNSLPEFLSQKRKNEHVRNWLNKMAVSLPATKAAVRDYSQKMLDSEPLESWEIDHDHLFRELAAYYDIDA